MKESYKDIISVWALFKILVKLYKYGMKIGFVW